MKKVPLGDLLFLRDQKFKFNVRSKEEWFRRDDIPKKMDPESLEKYKQMIHTYQNSIHKLFDDSYYTELIRMVDRMTEKLAIRHLEDWYNVKVNDFRQFSSMKFIEMPFEMLPTVLKMIYPNHIWNFPPKRGRRPKSLHSNQIVIKNDVKNENFEYPKEYWELAKNRLDFMEKLRKELNMETNEQLQHISLKLIREKGGGKLVSTLR